MIEMTDNSFHPGEYLQELLAWRRTSPADLARITGVPETSIVDVTRQRRGVDVQISHGLAEYFGNSPQYWLDLQQSYDRDHS